MRRIAWTLLALTFATADLKALGTEPQPDAAGVYSPSNGITSPKLVHAVPAVYPSDATPPRGKVSRTLSVVIGTDGALSAIESSGVSSDPLSLAAIAAVKQCRFTPGSLRKIPVPVRVLVWVPIVSGGSPESPAILPIPYDQPRSYDQPRAFDQPPTFIGAHGPMVQNEPHIPPKKLKYTAVEIVSLVVTDDGLPTDLQIVRSGNKDLDAKSLEVVQHYRFKPATKHGVPIPAQIMVEIDFHLSKKP